MAHLQDTLLPLVKNLLLLDAEGKRVAVKYFDDTWCVMMERGKDCTRQTLLVRCACGQLFAAPHAVPAPKTAYGLAVPLGVALSLKSSPAGPPSLHSLLSRRRSSRRRPA